MRVLFIAFWNWFTCHIASSCGCSFWDNVKEEWQRRREKNEIPSKNMHT